MRKPVQHCATQELALALKMQKSQLDLPLQDSTVHATGRSIALRMHECHCYDAWQTAR